MWLRLICIHRNAWMAWELIQNNSLGPKVAVPKGRNLKLAVISSFITVNWKHVRLDGVADGTSTIPFGEKLSLGLGGSRVCLFIQIAGKHSVFRKRRQLLLQFCPLFEQHSIIPHLSRRIEFLPTFKFFSDSWHPLSKGFTYIHLFPKATPQPHTIHSIFEWDVAFMQP